MGKTRFYTVRELMEMGKVRKDDTIKPLDMFNEQLVFADAISYNMLLTSKPVVPKSKTNEVSVKSGEVTAELPLFTLG